MELRSADRAKHNWPWIHVDAKATTWQNRAARQQARAPPGRNRTPNPKSSAPQSSQSPTRGFNQFDVADDGTPQWAGDRDAEEDD